MRNRFRSIISICVVLFVAFTVRVSAQVDEEDDSYTDHPKLTEEANKIYAANLKKYTNSADVLVLPGLVAKRKEQRVEVLVESTKISNNDAGEYFLIDQDSSHGYEAVFWSFAKPSDIHKALEFIGVRAGAPRDPRYNRYWSKGERIVVTLEDGNDATRIEELIYNQDTEKTLPEEGFIFTGSMTVDSPTGGAEKVYAADAYDPRSIIPTYNEPTSVMDVPWQATKGEFYESYIMNPEYPLKANALYTMAFEPAEKGKRKRSRDLVMNVNEKMEFTLTDTDDGKRLGTNTTYEAALKECRNIIKGGQDPYVQVVFADEMKLAHIRAVACALMMLDRPGGLYIEPPRKGRLYYRAFLPNPAWEDPANRFTQPWELHLSLGKKGKLTCQMVIHDTHWEMGATKPNLTKRGYKAATAEDVRKRLDQEDKERESASRRPTPRVLLVFVPVDLKYGELLKFLTPAMKTHDTVHLFLEDMAEGENLKPESGKE